MKIQYLSMTRLSVQNHITKPITSSTRVPSSILNPQSNIIVRRNNRTGRLIIMNHNRTRHTQILETITKVPEVTARIRNRPASSSTGRTIKLESIRSTVRCSYRDTVGRTGGLTGHDHPRDRRRVGNRLGYRRATSNTRNIASSRIDKDNIANSERLSGSLHTHNFKRDRREQIRRRNSNRRVRSENSVRDSKLSNTTRNRVGSSRERLLGSYLASPVHSPGSRLRTKDNRVSSTIRIGRRRTRITLRHKKGSIIVDRELPAENSQRVRGRRVSQNSADTKRLSERTCGLNKNIVRGVCIVRVLV